MMEKLPQPEPWSQHLDYLTRHLTEVIGIIQNCSARAKTSPQELEFRGWAL